MTGIFGTVLWLILIGFLAGGVWGQVTCQRDEAQAKSDDPSRYCRKTCTNDSVCIGKNKTCECDNDCGLSCFNPIATCDEVLSIANGTIRYKYPTDSSGTDKIYDTRATYTCNTGYHLLGEGTRYCRSYRMWSHTHSLPNCTRVCVAPGRTADGIPSTFGPFYVGDKVRIQCVAGYYAEAGSVLERTCQSDYTWSAVSYVCTIRNCGPPADVMHATYANRAGTTGNEAFNFGATIDYTCDTGYTLSGRSTFFCQLRDGGNVAWNQDSAVWLTCKAVECPMPTAPKNGEHDSLSISQFQFGYQVTYSCHPGYKLVGNKKGQCNAMGQWGETPTCKGSIDATFDNSDNDGYTVISGTFARTLKEQSNGLSGYVMAGSGTIRSVPISLSSGERICVKTEYSMADEDELKAQGFSNNREKDLRTFPESQTWTTTYFWLELVDKAADTEIELQFVATGEVYINIIAQDVDANCENELRTTASPSTGNGDETPWFKSSGPSTLERQHKCSTSSFLVQWIKSVTESSFYNYKMNVKDIVTNITKTTRVQMLFKADPSIEIAESPANPGFCITQTKLKISSVVEVIVDLTVGWVRGDKIATIATALHKYPTNSYKFTFYDAA